jgi:hypothetical protein
MGAPIQRVWHRISHSPLLGLLRGRATVPDPPEAVGRIALDKVPVTFRECEGVCEPTAG